MPIRGTKAEMLFPFTYLVDSASLAASATGTTDLTVQSDSLFWWTMASGSSSLDVDTNHMPNNFTVSIQDMSTGRLLSSAAVPQRIETPYLPGVGGKKLKRPVFLRPNSTLRFTFVNLDAGSANRIKYALHGYKTLNLPEEGKTTGQIIPYKYIIGSGSIAASGSAIVTQTIEPDSLFEWHGVAVSSTLDAATDVMPNAFEVQIRDLASGNFLSNALVSQRSDVPYGGRDLMVPVLVSPGTVLEFNFLNLDAGSAQTITYALIGAKIFL